MDVRKLNDKQNQASDRKQKYPLRKQEPPWLETVSVTPELVYRYKMAVRGLEDILEADLNTLKEVHQASKDKQSKEKRQNVSISAGDGERSVESAVRWNGIGRAVH